MTPLIQPMLINQETYTPITIYICLPFLYLHCLAVMSQILLTIQSENKTSPLYCTNKSVLVSRLTPPDPKTKWRGWLVGTLEPFQ